MVKDRQKSSKKKNFWKVIADAEEKYIKPLGLIRRPIAIWYLPLDPNLLGP